MSQQESPKSSPSPSESSQDAAPRAALWSADAALDADLVAYAAGQDARLDDALLRSDLLASAAHTRGLERIGVLNAEECKTLITHLEALLAEEADGTFRVGPHDEDGHSAIERELVTRAGEVGKKVHTGRSRNDQVLVATRLWMREEVDGVAKLLVAAARACLEKAEQTKDVLLPGYTHLQRAVPSTAGFFFAGHAESLLEDALALNGVRALLDRNPLGTAAGYGVNLKLDRDAVSEELGFSQLQVNGLAAQNSRGRFEMAVLAALMLPMATARRLAWDLSLFTTTEYGFVRMGDVWCTGSSIMPNKRNPDLVELIRSAFGEVAGAHAELSAVLAVPSGYQRDLQRTKPPLLRGLRAAKQTLALLARLVRELEMNVEASAAGIDADMLATDRAIELAKSGVPFRTAYDQVKKDLAQVDDVTGLARQSIEARTSPGGPGDLLLDRLEAFAEAIEKTLK